MIWFQRLFPAFMLLWPALLTSCVKRHPTLAAPDAERALRRLWVFTALALVVFTAVQVALELTLPERHGLRAGWPIVVGSAGSMALFFRAAMPALIARSPGWGGPGARPATRTASLEARDGADLLPRWAMPLGWIVCALCAAVMAWAISRGAPAALLLGLGFWLGMGLGCRAAAREPEPLDAQASASVREAYRSARRLRAWGFWSLGLAGTLCFTVVAALAVERPMTAGLAGAVGGTLIGVAGGVFGTVASISRARINTALHELARDAETSPGGASASRSSAT